MIVKSKYGLDRIVWDDSALRSQGGQIQHSGSQSAQDYQAILPAYVQGGSNIYKVTARAYDRNGNSSNNVQLTITVLSNGQVVDQVGVTDFTADKTSAKADNADTITYTATVKKNGVAQANVPVSFNIVSGTATLGANSAKTDANGKATVTLKSSTPGQVVVSAKTAEMTSALNASAVIFFDQTKASITEIKADKTTAVANGKDAIKYTVKVMKNGQPVNNQSVTFSTNFGMFNGKSQTQATTGNDGRATITLTSSSAGKATVSATVSDGAEVKATEVTFFDELKIDNKVDIIGNNVRGELPNIWLQYGQFKLKASGGDGTYSWYSENTSIATVDASGKVTLNGKGSVVIKATSGDKQTVSYTIKAPSYMIKVDKQAYYADAMSICKNLLPSTQTVLSDIYDSWGAANKYSHYSSMNSITAWIKQTSSEQSSGVSSTYNLITQNPLPRVNVNTPNVYAVCVE